MTHTSNSQRQSAIGATVAILAMALAHFSTPTFYLSLAIPLAYLMWRRSAKGGVSEDAASRCYLMYFLMGLTGMVLEASSLGDDLQFALTQMAESGDDASEAWITLIARMPDIMLHALLPLASGVAVYVLFGNFSISGAQASHGSITGDSVAELAALLQQGRIPEAAAQLITAMVSQTERLSVVSQQFATATESAAGNLETIGTEARRTAQQLQSLGTQTGVLTADVQMIQQQIAETRRDISKLQTSVGDIGQVVEDFSEIAASRILNFSYETAQPIRDQQNKQDTVHA